MGTRRPAGLRLIALLTSVTLLTLSFVRLGRFTAKDGPRMADMHPLVTVPVLRLSNETNLSADLDSGFPSPQHGGDLFVQRRSLMHSVCRSGSPLVLNSVDEYIKPEFIKGNRRYLDPFCLEPVITGALVSDKDQFLVCQINKAGTAATNDFFTELSNGKMPLLHGLDNYKRNQKWSLYYKVSSLPVREVLKSQSTYRKMVIVRHPLQRLVSAYYQIVVSGMRQGEGINNFTQFLQDRVLDNNWFNVHWLSYQEACFPCLVDYDYILKMETLDEEFPQRSQEMGFGLNTSYVHTHGNQNVASRVSSKYKYDWLLAKLEREEPILFKKVLLKYEADMDMFGYTWSNHRSGTTG